MEIGGEKFFNPWNEHSKVGPTKRRLSDVSDAKSEAKHAEILNGFCNDIHTIFRQAKIPAV